MTPPAGPDLIGKARTLSASLPELLVEASRVAATVASGWHGRRQAGPGEAFWQFRPFAAGESVTRIDWRRSARDDDLHVREREWENAHTIWLWADLTSSMDWRSTLSPVTKRDRAVVLMLAMADLLARGGERIGLPGLTRASPDRRAAERIATVLAHIDAPAPLPETTPIRRFSDVVIIADLLDPLPAIASWMAEVSGSGAKPHLVMVLDPAEETFPFHGRTEFLDPETGTRVTAGRAEGWATDYRATLLDHRQRLADLARRNGGSFLIHHTDRPASEPLIALHGRLSGANRATPTREAAR